MGFPSYMTFSLAAFRTVSLTFAFLIIVCLSVGLFVHLLWKVDVLCASYT